MADEGQGISINEEEKIESLYNYITNMKSKYEILNDLDVREFVDNFIQTGDGGVSNEDIYKVMLTYLFKELAASQN